MTTHEKDKILAAMKEAGIGTIAFGIDKHNGMAFACDYKEIWDQHGCYDLDCDIDIAAYYGFFKPNQEIRDLLRKFFTSYEGKLTWHNAAYDLKCIIYALWMKDPLDQEGLLQGLEIMTRHIDDTKIIAYLATNSTAGNVLGLKPLAHEFAGNWAVEESAEAEYQYWIKAEKEQNDFWEAESQAQGAIA